MDKSSKNVKEKKSNPKTTKSQSDKTKKKPNKKIKGQKDIRSLIKSKKNELLKYTKDFDLVCKQSGIDVDPEQLQLAIALSKSLHDKKSYIDEDTTNTEKSLTCNQRRNKIRTTLQEYGFQTKSSPIKKAKKYRKHHKLILVPDTEKQQKIGDKYAQILIRNVCIHKTNEVSPNKKETTNSHLYNLATNALYDFIKDDDIFYVNNLVPKCLHKTIIFKDWSQIPGRPVSPQLKKLDQSFKNIECSHEELNKILSGPIEIAQDIVKRKYKENIKTAKTEDNFFTETGDNQENTVEIKSINNLDLSCKNKDIKSNSVYTSIDAVSHSGNYNMSVPTNRSCSPDLFDDEVTLIMDSTTNQITAQDDLPEKIMVKEQNFLMELTNCVGNYTDSKHVTCLSQGSNKTRLDLDCMDLTECIPACSQKMLNNFETTSNYEIRNENDFNMCKKNNDVEQDSTKQELNLYPNYINNINPSSGNDDKELDDTIIMIDEDYNHIIPCNKYAVTNLSPKENVIIDLIETKHKSSKTFSTIEKPSDSVVGLEACSKETVNNNSFYKHYQHHSPDEDTFEIIPNQDNKTKKENTQCAEDNFFLDTVDLTQPFITDNGVLLMNAYSLKSNVSYEQHIESENILRNSDHSETENECRNDDDKLIKNKSFDTMDLTQSSNSEDCLQEAVNEAEDCDNNKSLDDVIALSNEKKQLDGNNEIIEDVDIYCDTSKQDRLSSNSLKNDIEDIQNPIKKTDKNIHTISDIDNDYEFDNLIENVSNSKQSNTRSFALYKDKSNDSIFSNLLDNCTNEKQLNNEEVDLTVGYDFSDDKLCSPKTLTDKVRNINGEAGSNGDSTIEVEKDNIETGENWDADLHNSEIVVNRFLCANMQRSQSLDSKNDFDNIHEDSCESFQHSKENLSPYCNNVIDNQSDNISNMFKDDHDNENVDIDLTQKSDSSESTTKIIEVPDELGKRNNISIDYDEVSVVSSFTRHYETSFDIQKNVENDKSISKNEDVSVSSQHSEVFELLDDELNYSVNKHKQDNESLPLKQAKFDIGGISIIDEFLSRNSLPSKDKIRCSCSSSCEPNTIDNKVQSCVPVVSCKNNENQLSKKITGESKSCEDVEFVKVSTPLKSRSVDNILIAKTPKHNDYIIKTDQITPMPNYESMTSPERDEELDKFGIKPLKRKRAIQILTHIYNQTHPLMEIMSDDEHLSPSKVSRKNNQESFPMRAIASQIDSILAHSSASSNHEILETNLSQKSKSSKGLSKTSQKSSHKGVSKENVLYEETTNIPDVRNIECPPEDWIFQKREKAKVHSCRVPLHIAFHNYVSSRNALRQAILKYEPINIDDIHKELVASGYRYNPKDLLRFMDKKCITVKTADNSRKNKITQ